MSKITDLHLKRIAIEKEIDDEIAKTYGKKIECMFNAISANLIKKRTEAGYTQEELALLIGSKRTTVTNIENKKQQPTVTHLVIICIVLDTTPNELMGISNLL